MQIMTKQCGDHYHAALFDENDNIVLEAVGSTKDEALYELDLMVLADILMMLGLDEEALARAPRAAENNSHLN